MRKAIARSIGLKLYDISRNVTVSGYYRLYKQSFQWDGDRIRDFQLARLKELMTYAFENVPFYKERMKENSFDPRNLSSPEQMADLPTLTRRNISNHLQALISERHPQDSLQKSSSSGTTGIPISYYNDKRGIGAGIGAAYALFHMTGWEPGDRRINIWGNPVSVKRWVSPGSRAKQIVMNFRNFPASEFTKEDFLDEFIAFYKKFKPDYLYGYSSSISFLAGYLQKKELQPRRLKRVITTAEALYPYQRTAIEENLGPVSDLYGCGEVNGIAMECSEGHFHILEPRVLVEEGEDLDGQKSILLTDLENYGMPFIRYDVGDLFDRITRERNCPCGLPFYYFKKIIGRSSELIQTPDGRHISPITIFGGTAFRKVKSIMRHQTVWNGKKLIFRFQVGEDFRSEEKEMLGRIINETLAGYKLPWEMETTVKDISGGEKFTYFKIEKEDGPNPG